MLKIYQCEKCKKTIVSKDELKLEGWVELKVGSVDAAKEKHVPVVTVEGNLVKAVVGSVSHPMTQEHGIRWVVLETLERCQRKRVRDWSTIKTSIKNDLSGYLYKTTKRNPMILPVITEL